MITTAKYEKNISCKSVCLLIQLRKDPASLQLGLTRAPHFKACSGLILFTITVARIYQEMPSSVTVSGSGSGAITT